MTREEALKLAEDILEDVLRSGEGAVFDAARRSDGTIDQAKIVVAAVRAREKLADIIMKDPTVTTLPASGMPRH
jgi:hypothetical protein